MLPLQVQPLAADPDDLSKKVAEQNKQSQDKARSEQCGNGRGRS